MKTRRCAKDGKTRDRPLAACAICMRSATLCTPARLAQRARGPQAPYTHPALGRHAGSSSRPWSSHLLRAPRKPDVNPLMYYSEFTLDGRWNVDDVQKKMVDEFNNLTYGESS